MANIQINTDLCKGCGRCVQDCLFKVLKIENGKVCISEENKSKCINCSHCAAICNSKAISLYNLPITPNITTHETVEDAIKYRRSIRQFKPTPIPNEEIKELLSITKYSPSACNIRPVKFLVINRPKLTQIMAILSKAGLENPKLPPLAKQTCLEQQTEDVIGRGCPHMVIAYGELSPLTGLPPLQDAAICLSQFELYATQKGYGTFWCGFLQVLLQSPQALALIGLKDVKCLGCMGLGIPNVKYSNMVQRTETEIAFLE